MIQKFQKEGLDDDTAWRVAQAYIDGSCPNESTLREPRPSESRREGKQNGKQREKLRSEKKRERFDQAQQRKKKDEEKAKAKARINAKAQDTGYNNQTAEDCTTVGSVAADNIGSIRVARTHTHFTPEDWSLGADVHKGFDWGIDNVDQFILPFVEKVEDVLGDGHCGYRALCRLLDKDENAYKTMRRQLVDELLKNKPLYKLDIVGDDLYSEMVMHVNNTGQSTRGAGWMCMPFVGFAFATLFQTPLVALSRGVPHMCLPMTTDTPERRPTMARLAIALVGCRNHWVPVSSFFYRIRLNIHHMPFIA